MGAGLAALAANEILGGSAIGVVAAGSAQTDATQLSQGLNTVGTTGSSEGVLLPPAEKNAMCVIDNQGAQTLTVYPREASGVTVDSTTSASIATSKSAVFFCTGLDWIFLLSA
jgi:hypothetical protein